MTGGGAQINYGAGDGNLLWKLQPATGTAKQNFTTASKDQVHPSPANHQHSLNRDKDRVALQELPIGSQIPFARQQPRAPEPACTTKGNFYA
jgi:hypothetical protein